MGVKAIFNELPPVTRAIDLPRAHYDVLYNFIMEPGTEAANLGEFIIVRGRGWTLKIYKVAELDKPIAVLEPNIILNHVVPIRVLLVVAPGCLPLIYFDGNDKCLKNVVLNNYDTFLTTEGTDTMPARPIFAYELRERMLKYLKFTCQEEKK